MVFIKVIFTVKTFRGLQSLVLSEIPKFWLSGQLNWSGE